MTNPVFARIADLREHLQLIPKSKTVGFVPTMGALHDGHLELVRRSNHECDYTVVSIFVNPTQFSADEDLNKYPRQIDQDIQKLSLFECRIFTPSESEMTPGLNDYEFVPTRLGRIYEGKFRPTHFEGVCKIVMKLFQIVQPTRAYFGEKDYQQLVIINHMVHTFSIPVQIVPCPTVREHDGLAMSSRNVYLSPEDRIVAGKINRFLDAVKLEFIQQPKINAAELLEFGRRCFNSESKIRLDYLAIVKSDSLEEIDGIPTENDRILVAARVGNVRLLDNMSLI